MGGGGGGNTKTTTEVKLPSWLRAIQQQAVAIGQDYVNRPYESYAGELVAGLTPDQQASIDYTRRNLGQTEARLTGLGEQFQPTLMDSTSAFASVADDYADLPAYAGNFFNPHVAAVETAALRNLERTGAAQQQDLAEQAIKVGSFGGAREGVQRAILQGELAGKAGELSANLRSQAYRESLATAQAALQGRQAAATGALSSVGSALTTQGNIFAAAENAGRTSAADLMQSGALQQEQQQAILNDLYARWREAKDYDKDRIGTLISIISGLPSQGSTVRGGSGAAAGPGKAAGAVGGAASGALSGAAIGSAFPGYGTAVGAVIGGVLGGVQGYTAS